MGATPRQAATDLVATGALRLRTNDCPVCFARRLLLYVHDPGAEHGDLCRPTE
jgi:hypothetical protein